MYASIQPQTFALVVCHYSRHSGRCICGDTVRQTIDGEWRHHDGNVWCRPSRA